jgi:hypothetical protein
VAGCCEYGDEPSGSGATELVIVGTLLLEPHQFCFLSSYISVPFSEVFPALDSFVIHFDIEASMPSCCAIAAHKIFGFNAVFLIVIQFLCG